MNKRMDNELDILCVYAERYATSGMTHFVGEVREIIRRHLKDLKVRTLLILIDDIDNSLMGDYGMDTDKKEWMDLLSEIREEYQNRNIYKGKEEK